MWITQLVKPAVLACFATAGLICVIESSKLQPFLEIRESIALDEGRYMRFPAKSRPIQNFIPESSSGKRIDVVRPCVKAFCSDPFATTNNVTECNARCNCEWQWSINQCGCMGEPGLPQCQSAFPVPNRSDLDRLAAGHNGLRFNDRISLFGDSLTWLGGYEKLIRKALMTAGLRGLNIFNHGRNGATLQDVQSGGDEWRTFPYHAWLQIEKPTIVVIFAGTNDVRNYPHIEYFEPTLTEMIDQAKSINATVIVSTLFLWSENVNSTSDNNVRLEAISHVIRRVVASTNVNLMDLRQDAVSYELMHNHNSVGDPIEHGILTRDMFHPCQSDDPPCPDGSYGNLLIANSLARTLLSAVKHRD